MIKSISECFVKPKHSVAENAKKPVYLSPSDLLLLSVHYNQKGLLFAKPSPPTSSIQSLLAKLRESLSLSLVHFYTLAGQLETQLDEDEHTSLIFIDPNKGPGARFIHATFDLTVADILSPNDVPKVVHSFFDVNERAVSYDGHTRPLLSVQVTELVDGVFIGCSINHVCVDGNSHWHFFSVWSEIFMSDGGESYLISRPPIQDRWFMDESRPFIKLPFTQPYEFVSRFEPPPNLRERIFHFSAESVAELKARANADRGTDKISSFQALLALIWRSITRARRVPHDQETTCDLAIDMRFRLNPPLSQDYVGNYVQSVQQVRKVGELLDDNLGWAALMLNQAIADHDDQTVRRKLEKWINSPVVFLPGDLSDDSYIFRVGGSPRFNIYGNEFGMGKALAVLSGYANKFDGKAIAYPGRDGGGSVDFEICLLPDYMSALEADEEFMNAVSSTR